MLSGKVVIVTGASGGLGAFVVPAFLQAGAHVVGVSRSIQDSEFEHPNFRAERRELANVDQATELVENVITHWRRLDAVVHLVGAFAAGTAVDDTPEASFSRMLDLNFYSFLRIAQAAIPLMRRQGGGSLIAVGSRTALEPAAMLGAYSASKAALISLVRTLALENKRAGVTVNAILPGTLDTTANRAAMPAADPGAWVRPDQIANLAVYLASPAAAQITGASIPVFGGEL